MGVVLALGLSAVAFSSEPFREVDKLPRQDDDYLKKDGHGALLRLRKQVTDRNSWVISDGETNGQMQNANQLPSTVTVLIHGMKGAPSDFNSVVKRVVNHEKSEIFAFVYDDYNRLASLNSLDLAAELRSLSDHLANQLANNFGNSHPRLKIIAHSLGGLIAFAALSTLKDDRNWIEQWSSIDFLAIDTPWHGFSGPSDIGNPFKRIWIRQLLPDGLVDLRSGSFFLNGGQNQSPFGSQGILKKGLPPQVNFYPVFAQSGEQAEDYTEGELTYVPDLLVRFVSKTFDDVRCPLPQSALLPSLRQKHFIDALMASHNMSFLIEDLRRFCQKLNEEVLADLAGVGEGDAALLTASMPTTSATGIRGSLTRESIRVFVLDRLRRYFAKIPGGHTSVIDSVSESHELNWFW
jgi:hypothetical protein